jgi:hypothetical protein
VQGLIGVSNDGDYVYFVAHGALAQGAMTGEPNLYLLHEGTPIFITTLAESDLEHMRPYEGGAPDRAGDLEPGLGQRTAEVTPNGQALVFMSSRSLTGYDNLAPANGGQLVPTSEVYLYEAGDAKLVCVSCARSGEPPQASSLLEQGETSGYLPVSWSNTYIPQWLSGDGSRVFFDSDIPLVPQDTNGTQDVYEWERDGAGSCQESKGCIYLISDGINETASWLIGASATGRDVFFVSRAKLTPDDGTDTDVLYDARADGTQPPAPPQCSGTGCQGVPGAPPVFATPSSVTFGGVGNFPPPANASAGPKKPKASPRLQKGRKSSRSCKARRLGKSRTRCKPPQRRQKTRAARARSTNSMKGRK